MDRHKDNIGFLRLLFASLVIISHSQEQIYGNRSHELLTRIFHTVSLGDLAVDAFFLISGYLITMSWMNTKSINKYLSRRIRRIYPAFILSYLLCVFALGPFVGADPSRRISVIVYHLVTLQTPETYPGQLGGLPSPELNGPMWTIAYEFRCYLLVVALGITGLINRRWFMLVFTAIGVGAMIGATFHLFGEHLDALDSHQRLNQLIGKLRADIRLTTTFLVGACFYLFRDDVLPRLNYRIALLLGVITIALLFRDPHLAEAVLITLGAACLFWIGFKANIGWLQSINDRWDISYGVYLYGWPIATAIRWLDRSVSPLALAAMTLPLALLAGAASWWGVEKWTKGRSESRSMREPKRQNFTATTMH